MTSLTTMSNEIAEFTSVRKMYATNKDFRQAWEYVGNPKSTNGHLFGEYFLQDDYLFKGRPLCIPKNIIKELHSGGLGEHFGKNKTVALVEDRYFCPGLMKQVGKFVE
eukprot:Gb_13529 [translate_table: standard]